MPESQRGATAGDRFARHEGEAAFYSFAVQREGVTGASAGDIAAALGVPPATLSFHLAALSQAALVRKHRESRRVIYAADFTTMNAMLAYLTENCCAESGAQRAPAAAPRRSRSRA